MILSEMKRLLASRDIRLRRSLGQNFLHDQNQVRRIVAAAELTRADHVLEIGPGLGPLTERLLEAAGSVLVIEKDPRLAELFRDRFQGVTRAGHPSAEARAPAPWTSQDPVAGRARLLPSRPVSSQAPQERRPTTLVPPEQVRTEQGASLQLVQADALDYLRANRCDWSDWKLVSNLPYSAASAILVELARAPAPPQRMVVTLQLEVAQRLAAGPGGADYGLLSLLIQLRYEPGAWFQIPPTCFHPPPEVDSACITLVRRSAPLLAPGQAEVFERLVRRGFSQRRKMLLKLLKMEWPADRLEAAFEQLELPRQARAESLTVAQFVRLAASLSPERQQVG